MVGEEEELGLGGWFANTLTRLPWVSIVDCDGLVVRWVLMR